MVYNNTVRDNWIVNDLITRCVAEEEKLKSEKLETVNMVSSSKSKSKEKWQSKKFKSHAPKNTSSF